MTIRQLKLKQELELAKKELNRACAERRSLENRIRNNNGKLMNAGLKPLNRKIQNWNNIIRDQKAKIAELAKEMHCAEEEPKQVSA